MARWKLTPRKNIPQVVTEQEWAKRFRAFNREIGLSFGDFLPKYFALWEKAKNYVTDYEASEELINQVPKNWRPWADAQRKQLTFRDSFTHALRCHFPRLICRLFEQWIMNGEPPNSADASSNVDPVESSDHASSDEHCGSVLRSHKAISPYKGGHDFEAGTSTKFVLHRVKSNSNEDGFHRIREMARKRALDDGGHDHHVDVGIKRSCGVIPVDQEGGPNNDARK